MAREPVDLERFTSAFAATMSAIKLKADITPLSALALVITMWCLPRLSRKLSELIVRSDPHDPDATDSDFLKQNSRIEEVKTSRFTYPGIRVFFKRHPEQKELPGSLPLLVFIHGLGGSVSQFEGLLKHFTCRASCLAIDLPGCGRSKYAMKAWDAYSTDALVEFLEEVIGQYVEEHQSIVLVGHSYGTVLAARLALPGYHGTRAVDTTKLDASSIIGICPAAKKFTEKEVSKLRRLLCIPETILNLWRAWDRRGGINSQSVTRFTGPNADEASRRLQLRFNAQSRSPVIRRMALGSIAEFTSEKHEGGIPGLWANLRIPVLLVTGEKDHVTKPQEAEQIHSARDAVQSMLDSAPGSLQPSRSIDQSDSTISRAGSLTISTILESTSFTKVASENGSEQRTESTPSTPTSHANPPIDIPPPPKPAMLTERVQLPAPAGHGLFYDPCYVNPVSGIIAKFLTTQVTGRFDLGWQLRFLSRGGKWDVKNLAKWRDVQPVSEPIAGIFRAMKTLREADDVHSPAKLVQDWGTEIKDVVDISHDRPVYAPQGLVDRGIAYHKFPTVSKVPPTKDEAKRFVILVDKIRKDREQRANSVNIAAGLAFGDAKEKAKTIPLTGPSSGPEANKPLIGVHCHYGFNRTGFFIVSYLVERCGYTIQDAVNEFATRRPNGIRHAHFLETLWLRYGSGAGSGRGDGMRGGGTGEGAEWGE